MDTVLSMLIELLTFGVVAAFAVAAAADLAIKWRERARHERPRRVPQRAHGSHA